MSKRRIIISVLNIALLASGCSTQSLIRYEPSEKLETKKNFEKQVGSEKYKILITKVEENKEPFLNLKIEHSKDVTEKWEDIYSQTAVYEKQCRSWYGTMFFGKFLENKKYCEFDWEHFALAHILVIGFVLDLETPFLDYEGQTIEIKEDTDKKISKPEISNYEITNPTSNQNITLTLNDVAAKSYITNSVAKVSFKSLKLNQNDIPISAKAVLKINNQSVDISNEYAEFASAEKKKKQQLESAQKKEQSRPEIKYKMPFCYPSNLIEAVFSSSYTVEKNCIYVLSDSLRVIQVIEDGILVTLTQNSQYMSDKVIFIKTSKQYVDGDLVRNILLHSIGTKKYISAIGAQKTIHAFEKLGEED